MFSRNLFACASAALLILAAPGANAATVLGSEITSSGVIGATYTGGWTAAGGSYWTVPGMGDLFELCAQAWASADMAPTYEVTEGFTYFNNAEADGKVVTLLTNAFPILDAAVTSYIAENGSLSYNAALASQWQTIGSYSSALQEMTWGILNDPLSQVDPSSWNRFIMTEPSLSEGAGYMVQWANHINDGTWQANDSVKIFYADSSDRSQDRIWLQMATAVPEPATWTMMIVGFGAIGSMVRTARRRSAFVA